ncbi:TRAP transporter small permease [Amorphus sp. 3PC139-8]|uniref:TRAP transporter small permease n=1 Tax=Amorphus sp. 3PC139-8 TaxID=2735676 RepID=UPI00345C6792
MSQLREISAARLLDGISGVSAALGACVMGLMAVHVVTDVAFRYFAGFSLAGTTEIVSRYYMVTLIFLPLAYVQRKGQHIDASLLADLLSPRFQVLLGCLSAALMALYATLIGWRAATEALRATEISEKIQTADYFLLAWPARWIPVLAMALVVAISIIELATHAYRFWNWKRLGRTDVSNDFERVTPI